MKKFIETLKNCWRIEDLRQRLLITLLFTAIYRFGSFVVLPGINPGMLDKLQSQTSGGLMSLLDMFSGGAFSNASIFALGIMPYISASIVMQLLAVAVPYFQKMQREGESGRKKITWYTRILTVFILLFQAPSYLLNLKAQAAAALSSGISWTMFMIPATIILAAGSMFILWLGERITDKGVGNGISMIIMIGIIARLPQAFVQELGSRFTAISSGGLVMFIIEILVLYAVICASIMLVQGTRKIPVQYAKRLVGNKQYGGARQYIIVRSQCDAYHLCSGFDVHSFGFRTLPERRCLVLGNIPYGQPQPPLQRHLCYVDRRIHLLLYGNHTQPDTDG